MPPRFVITVKDIMNMSGVDRVTAWRTMRELKDFYKKPPEAWITVEELCAYKKVTEEKVKQFLK